MLGQPDIKFSQHIFEKNAEISNFMKIHPVKALLFHADGQPDKTKLTVAFRNFANAAKSHKLPQTTKIHFFRSQFDQLQVSGFAWFGP